MLTESLWQPSADRALTTARRVEYQLDGIRKDADPTDVSDVAFEDCGPVREFPSWPHKRFYSGRFWMARTSSHIEFESLAERQCLMELDRIQTVHAVASQPMWIEWDGTSAGRHAPDYFVRSGDGTATLVDVRPLTRIDARAQQQFDCTAAFCLDMGWQYLVYAPESKTRDANLRFLLRYRDKAWKTERPRASHSGTIAEIAEELGSARDGLARCYAAIWEGQLHADLEQPLSLRTSVRWKETS